MNDDFGRILDFRV